MQTWHFYFEQKNRIKELTDPESWVDKKKILQHFRLSKKAELRAPSILDTRPLLMRQQAWSTFPALALSCKQYIYTNQKQQHSRHSPTRTPSPQECYSWQDIFQRKQHLQSPCPEVREKMRQLSSTASCSQIPVAGDLEGKSKSTCFPPPFSISHLPTCSIH